MQVRFTRAVSGWVLPALVAMGMLVSAGAASAATVSRSGAAERTLRSTLAADAHGDLISYTATTVKLGTGAPGVKAYTITYRTEDALGHSDVATGTVLVPTARWTGRGDRPVIDYAPGTQGLGEGCQPSAQLVAGTEYETPNLVALLAKRWAVVITDYQGYTSGSSSLYIIGRAEGHAVLDATLAADQIPKVGITAAAPTAVWGYSQGGGAALWATTLAPTYDPTLNLVGVAAGGVVSNLLEEANYLNGNAAAGFAGDAVVGLSDQYPSDFPLASLVNPQGAAAIAQLKGDCVFSTLFNFNDQNFNSYLQPPNTLASLEAQPSIASDIAAQDLGSTKIGVPLFEYHGQADQVVPLDEATTLKQQYCKLGVTDEFELYPSEHITTQLQAAPQVVSWISGRLAGSAAPSDCSDTGPVPVSTAPPPGGDYTINLNDSLSGALKLKKLAGKVTLPTGSTVNAVADANKQTLSNGTISIPSFSASLALLVVPIRATIDIQQTAPLTGTVAVNQTTGQLSINGSVQVSISLPSVKAVGLPIENNPSCGTTGPVTLPLTYSGPLGALGTGITFTGTTTFPSLANCGGLNGLLNGLFSGPGQSFSITATPPAPTAW